MPDIVYFASHIDPATGELTLERVEAPRTHDTAQLIVYDPTNADPTLAKFHEVRDEEQERPTATV